MSCRELRDRLAAYVDDELGVEASLEIEAHLVRCPACRAAADRQRDFRRTFATVYPRQRLPERARRQLLRKLGPTRPWPSLGTLALGVAASLAVLVGVWALGRAGLPAEVQAAIARHAAAERRDPALDIASSDLPAVNRWLREEVPLAGGIGLGPAALRLAGAASVRLGTDPAAWVLYRQDDEPVSLFVLPRRTWPAVGEAIHHRGIEFRALDVGGHRVIAWNHDPVSYLLVFARDRRPAEACAACHGGPGAPAIAGFAVPGAS
jgi:anti-sigma factor RsiW